METKDLLFEIGVEDLPPKNLNSFLEKIKKILRQIYQKKVLTSQNVNFFIRISD